MKRIKPSVPTTTVECGKLINGPKIGRNVVAWQKNCRVKVVVPASWGRRSLDGRCQHHRSSDQDRRLREALNPEITEVGSDND